MTCSWEHTGRIRFYDSCKLSKKVKVVNDQEMAQSERKENPTPKTKVGKTYSGTPITDFTGTTQKTFITISVFTGDKDGNHFTGFYKIIYKTNIVLYREHIL